MSEALDKVVRCAEAVELATRELNSAIAAAVEGGETKVAVAEAAGVTRQTVDRWLDAAYNEKRRVHVRSTIDEASLAAAGLLSGGGGQVFARIHKGDTASAVLTLKMAVKNVAPDVWRAAEPDMRDVIQLGTLVSSVAEAAYDLKGRWPEWVTLN